MGSQWFPSRLPVGSQWAHLLLKAPFNFYIFLIAPCWFPWNLLLLAGCLMGSLCCMLASLLQRQQTLACAVSPFRSSFFRLRRLPATASFLAQSGMQNSQDWGQQLLSGMLPKRLLCSGSVSAIRLRINSRIVASVSGSEKGPQKTQLLLDSSGCAPGVVSPRLLPSVPVPSETC